ncbi:MAG: tRNA (guanosine(37)-N1)-methyltransferase TrmD [Betaproteobacteria bacterium]|nr:tRNA (guanosine(37)-N1)-methyltransferase TrmD [Betaproteobacteria bacterium]
MRFDLITLFPDMADAITRHGITARALQRGLWQLRCWNPRDFTHDAWKTVDDRPYGGGPGMVMLAQPLAETIAAVRADRRGAGVDVDAGAGAGTGPGSGSAPVIALSPQGNRFSDARARALAASSGAILIAGRYEAIDQRLLDRYVDDEWSIGDFVVSGGELPAMMVMDAAVRHLPGALNDSNSAEQESFAAGLLDCPHYTRPDMFEGLAVPEVLLSGHHERISRWRREQALVATLRKRPDLLEAARLDGRLSAADEAFIAGQVLPR